MIFFPISHFIVIFAPKFITDMDLFDRISADIKSAMLAKDRVRLETLRGVKNFWKPRLPRVPTALLLMMQP